MAHFAALFKLWKIMILDLRTFASLQKKNSNISSALENLCKMRYFECALFWSSLVKLYPSTAWIPKRSSHAYVFAWYTQLNPADCFPFAPGFYSATLPQASEECLPTNLVAWDGEADAEIVSRMISPFPFDWLSIRIWYSPFWSRLINFQSGLLITFSTWLLPSTSQR